MIAVASVFAFLAAALTIYVVTDRGVLVIETFDDDLKVEIQKNGKPIGDAWKLEAGENRMTIRSGEYAASGSPSRTRSTIPSAAARTATPRRTAAKSRTAKSVPLCPS